MSGPRSLRRRLLITVLAAVIVGVGVLTLAFNLVLRERLDADINDRLHARAAAQLGALSTANGRLKVVEAPDDASLDSRAWIFSGGRVLEGPQTAPAALDRAARALAASGKRTASVSNPPTSLLAVPVRRGGRQLGVVVVAVSRASYDQTKRVALLASLAFAGTLVLAVGLLARWLVAAALHPVARMTADAARWSERDLDRRFGLGPPTDELTQLAATLDRLLDRLAAAMRHEQRFSSELSHELRTPLAKISTQAQLLATADDLPPSLREEAEAIVKSAASMREAIEALMAAARAESNGERRSADVTAAVRAAVDAARHTAAERGVTLDWSEPGGAMPASAEGVLVERMLAPILENASRFARTRATVRIEQRPGWITVIVEDDGQGVPEGEELHIFEPGVRGDSGAGAYDGAGLGLALARRLARSAGGDVQAHAGAGGRFSVRLPAA